MATGAFGPNWAQGHPYNAVPQTKSMRLWRVWGRAGQSQSWAEPVPGPRDGSQLIGR